MFVCKLYNNNHVSYLLLINMSKSSMLYLLCHDKICVLYLCLIVNLLNKLYTVLLYKTNAVQ